MNTPTKVCLGVSAALLVASAGGMTAANACPESDAPACDVAPAAPAAAPATPLLRVAAPSGAPSGGAVIANAVLTPDAPRAPVAMLARSPGQATAWTFDDDSSEAREVNIVSTKDGETYDLRMKDGDVIVKHNGKKLDDSRIKVKNEQVIILDDNGNTVREFQIRPNTSSPAGSGAFWRDDGGARVAVRASEAPRAMARVNTPPVMVGIHQSDVPAAVRWHLGLGDDTPAIMIERVIDGLPADNAGLHAYDVIVSIEGSDGATGETLSKVLREKNPGDGLKLYVISKGDKKKVELELVKYQGSALSIGSGGSVGVVPRAESQYFLPKGEGSFVFGDPDAVYEFKFEDPDVEYDFRFDDGAHEHEKRIHEEIRRKHEAILREFESQAHLEHRDHDRARIALEKAMAELDSNLAERVEMAERQAREARKHVMELRGNRLVLPEKFADRASELSRRSSEGLEERLEGLEARLEEMHAVIESQMERMMERMSRMLEEAEREMHKDHDG